MCRMPDPAVIHCVAPSAIRPAAPVRILMREATVDHVGDGLEPAVGMPVGAARFTRLVLDLTHLVHVDEQGRGRRH